MASPTLKRIAAPMGSGAYTRLRQAVRETLLAGQQRIEQEKIRTYWQTGRLIDQHLMGQQDRSEIYGKKLLRRLAQDLDVGVRLLERTLQFYRSFPKIASGRTQSLPATLKWTHYRALLTLPTKGQRETWRRRAARGDWNAEELQRKIRTEIQNVPPDGKSNSRHGAAADYTPLKAKLGSLYTYQLIRPEGVHPGREDLLIDLGFEIYRKISDADKRRFKAGDLVETQVPGSFYGNQKKVPGSWDTKPVPDSCDYRLIKSKRSPSALFTYRARVERIVDGDTLRVKIDLGFDTWTRQYLRLRGLNAPEISTAEGRRAAAWLTGRLARVPFIWLVSTRSDKYDRYLSDIWIPKQPAAEVAEGTVLSESTFDYINNEFLENKLAERVR